MTNGKNEGMVSMAKPKHEYIVKMGNDVVVDWIIPTSSTNKLVRCDDCRYWNAEKTYCWFHNVLTRSKFYCAKAEKKEGEQDEAR